MTDPTPSDTPKQARTKGSRRLAVLLAASTGLLMAGAGSAAFAVSGGGYTSYQQGCQPYDSDWATPDGQTYPGCHSNALNVESGGTTQGAPSDKNTKYAQVGLDQFPNDSKSQGTPTPESVGLPGNSGSPHAFCVSANTDGTNSAPAPTNGKNSGPEPAGKSAEAQNGCGDNRRGAGFDATFDYYHYYCPVAAMLGSPCEAAQYGTGNPTFHPDTGHQIAYQPIIENGILVYYGSDDNLDNGEHDGLGNFSKSYGAPNDGAQNGPSDGGAIMLVLDPMKVGQTPSQAHPEGLLNASMGFCADGICFEGTTQQQTVYHGCNAPDSNGDAPCDKGTPKDANVYNYAPGGNPANDPSVNKESPNCNSGDATSTDAANCGSGGLNAWRSATPANENAEPGVQLYSDPDPQRSPAAPSPFWPTPALYVGTCGVYAGSPATTGQVFGTSPTPVSNQAGQLAIDPNPSVC